MPLNQPSLVRPRPHKETDREKTEGKLHWGGGDSMRKAKEETEIHTMAGLGSGYSKNGYDLRCDCRFLRITGVFLT